MSRRLEATISRDRKPNTTGSVNPHRSRKSWKCQGNEVVEEEEEEREATVVLQSRFSHVPLLHPRSRANVPSRAFLLFIYDTWIVIRDRDRRRFRPTRLRQNFHVPRDRVSWILFYICPETMEDNFLFFERVSSNCWVFININFLIESKGCSNDRCQTSSWTNLKSKFQADFEWK